MGQIFNDDSLKILSELKDNGVDLIFTDPSYDLDQYRKIAFQQEFERVCKGQIIIFHPPENIWYPASDEYANNQQFLFWVKPISTKNTSKSYSRFVEMISVMGEGKWNTGRHWSQYTNVFTDLVEDNSLHPYRKPRSLVERILLNHTNKGDLVLDPFMGSGTIPYMCKKLGRDYIGIEIDFNIFKLAEREIDGTHPENT